MSETRKLAAILAADVAGYSRLTATDEERTIARLRGLRTDLIDPAISVHHGRVVKTTGDGILIEFRSVVDAVRCSIEVQNGMVERNAGLPPERQIWFRAGIHLGDVIEEADGDLMGDGVNIASRLENICDPGAICLSEQAYWQVKSRLDLAVNDLGNKELKNIPEPVHVFSLEVGKPAQAKLATPPISVVAAPPSKRRSVLLPLAGIAALIVIAAATAWFFLDRPGGNLTSNAPAHLSIVVLPFANLSGDSKQDYFADGVTDNLTTDLSRIRNSFVIARNTAFTYKGKNVDVREIGKELGVRYVLEGSVARDGNRVRVNAQLIDAESGMHLWADRFEDDLADLFKLQDDVVARLANSLRIELTNAESRLSSPKNPDALDLTMRGWALSWEQPTPQNVDSARRLFDQALSIEPENAEALIGKAYADVRDYAQGRAKSGLDYDARVLSVINRAIEIDPGNGMAYYVKGLYLVLKGRPEEAQSTALAGIARNPNLAPLYYILGAARGEFGDWQQSKSYYEQAIHLSPRDAQIGIWEMGLGIAEMGSKHYTAAIDNERKALDDGFTNFAPHVVLTAAYALSGNLTEARSELAEAQRLNPALTSVKWIRANNQQLMMAAEGLRLSGLPEDAPTHLSIVVLPFQNLSGDEKQDYLADVITDQLTTYIARSFGKDSLVIARNTAMTYKGKAVDVKEIGKELGVRYVMEGSVQPTSNRIRVNAQLIDAESGSHLWADAFDTDKSDLLQAEDQIVTRLASSLNLEVMYSEAAKAERVHPANPDAEDLALRCKAAFNKYQGAFGKGGKAGDNLCEQALVIDPNNVDALTTLSWAISQRVAGAQSTDRKRDTKRANELVSRALQIDRNNARAHIAKAAVLYDERRFDEAQEEAERAIALDPSDVDALGGLCVALYGKAQPESIISCADAIIRLSPHDPLNWGHLQLKGAGYLMLGKYNAALETLRQSAALNPDVPLTQAYLAATAALVGQDAEAHEALARYLSLPGTHSKTIAALKEQTISDNPTYLAMQERVYEGLRKAGMPDQ